jgi:ubiquinone/menaquinone biosynthesis C-methylase UbiE
MQDEERRHYEERIAEQIAYYRARAQEYDATNGVGDGVAEQLLRAMGPFDQILELACGTGNWTQILATMGREVTALDAAPEMLALARQKTAPASVHFQQADLFQWEPTQSYDLVFFAFWLSHVPPDMLDPFLEKISRAVKPGGYIAIVDEYAPMPEERDLSRDGVGGQIYAERPLLSGQTFVIVKVFYDLESLRDRLASLGFTVAVEKLDDIFFFLRAQRQ